MEVPVWADCVAKEKLQCTECSDLAQWHCGCQLERPHDAHRRIRFLNGTGHHDIIVFEKMLVSDACAGHKRGGVAVAQMAAPGRLLNATGSASARNATHCSDCTDPFLSWFV